MNKEHLENLKTILQKEKELFEQLNNEWNKLISIGKEQDDEYLLFRYRKEIKHLKIDITEFANQYKRKNEVLEEIVSREDLKQNFKIIK